MSASLAVLEFDVVALRRVKLGVPHALERAAAHDAADRRRPVHFAEATAADGLAGDFEKRAARAGEADLVARRELFGRGARRAAARAGVAAAVGSGEASSGAAGSSAAGAAGAAASAGFGRIDCGAVLSRRPRRPRRARRFGRLWHALVRNRFGFVMLATPCESLFARADARLPATSVETPTGWRAALSASNSAPALRRASAARRHRSRDRIAPRRSLRPRARAPRRASLARRPAPGQRPTALRPCRVARSPPTAASGNLPPRCSAPRSWCAGAGLVAVLGCAGAVLLRLAPQGRAGVTLWAERSPRSRSSSPVMFKHLLLCAALVASASGSVASFRPTRALSSPRSRPLRVQSLAAPLRLLPRRD